MMALLYLHGLLVFLLHPFHVSVVDVEYKPERQALEIAQRIFTDDFELAIKESTGNAQNLLDPANKALADSLISGYLANHFTLQVNGQPCTMYYLGFEADTDVIWTYIEVPQVPAFTQVQVSSQVLLKQFNDQVNLVHINNGQKTKSLRLDGQNDTGTVTFD